MAAQTEQGGVGLPVGETRGFTVLSVLAAMLGGVIAAWILSWIYGPAEHYSPLIYLNLLLAYGMGWAIGWVAKSMVRKKRINRSGPALAVGLASGLGGLFFAWVAYIWVITDYDFAAYRDCLLNPLFVWDILRYLAHNPVWSLGKGGNADPAFFYYIAWLCEAALIVGLPMLACRRFLRENLLCEHCKEWLQPTGDLAFFDVSGEGAEKYMPALEAGDLTPLYALPRLIGTDDVPAWLEAQGLACPNCRDCDSFINLTAVVLEANKKKEVVQKRATILQFFEIDVETERKIFEPAEKLREEWAAGSAAPSETPENAPPMPDRKA